jgi:16S rRNA G1207 methylase RsmC
MTIMAAISELKDTTVPGLFGPASIDMGSAFILSHLSTA